MLMLYICAVGGSSYRNEEFDKLIIKEAFIDEQKIIIAVLMLWCAFKHILNKDFFGDQIKKT